MNAQAEALTLLHDLTAEDRAWLIAQLPAEARSRLLAESDANEGGDALKVVPASRAPEVDASESSALDGLVTVDVAALALVLKDEPPWLIAALLEARTWSWATEFLDALPALTRSQVTSTRRAGCSFAPLLAETLARLIVLRLGHGEAPRSPSTFETLVARLSAARSKKRLSIHL